MKKVFLASLVLTILTSCTGSSDIIPDDTSGDINGVWMLKAQYGDNGREGLTECRLLESISFEGNSVIMVKADEKGNSECNVSTSKGTFSKTETNLLLTIGNENIQYKIKELTKTKLFVLLANSSKAFTYERAE
ncbi:lipocalin-like domain-containing protein [Flavobacterium quisquiliarum]|uniref:Lipocalin family protein n=1 Tax=Flavobacterium quisquiliarum TaxID=1834436 RepID=A0ABV8W580_9FLAO|nr:lipocalin family protein [Flavobacterium quisquiliarum]MBW1655667.1 hypothetical protein [Flavobacterium quisquiliarum]NWL03291.1 hypothetical protein [Flavobacterium collinsii]